MTVVLMPVFFNAIGTTMFWLGLTTLSIGAFIIECLFFLFILQIPYFASALAASLNVAMGLFVAGIAYWRRQPVETWLIYGAFAWPAALIHLLSIPSNRAQAVVPEPVILSETAEKIAKTAAGQEIPRLP
ncbi:hypothetical protein ACFPL7_18675 [Dongia soli]|uniref:Uncharacterized protein n=1 Tax=Dongia soli TaxID=600628 RepID=A0ABU5E5Z2_9PROT|nr:hypothetical protein [Dongia soli]MDY0881618.1 hypothetical protein [Dongia soli]